MSTGDVWTFHASFDLAVHIQISSSMLHLLETFVDINSAFTPGSQKKRVAAQTDMLSQLLYFFEHDSLQLS